MTSPNIKKSFQAAHQNLKLQGKTPNALLKLPAPLFNYLIGILKDESPKCPEVSTSTWNNFIATLQSQDSLPYLYWKLRLLPEKCHPPQAILNNLRDYYLTNSLKVMLMEKQISNLQKIFQKQNIPFIIIKGIALGALYDNPSTRYLGDSDLLMPIECIPKAHQILIDLGYECIGKNFPHFTDTFHANEYIHKSDPHLKTIDLHWRLFEKWGLFKKKSFSGYMATAQTGKYYQTLSLVDTFLYAVFHTILHHSTALRLKWIIDLSVILQRISEADQLILLKQACIDSNLILATEHAVKLITLWTNIKIPQTFSNFSEWPKPIKKEYFIFKHCLKRDTKFISWLILARPHGLSFIEAIKLLRALGMRKLTKIKNNAHTKNN